MSPQELIATLDMSIPPSEQLKRLVDHGYHVEEKIQVDMFVEILDHIMSPIPSLLELGTTGVDGSFYSLLFEKRFAYNCTIINTEPMLELLDGVRSLWKDRHLINAKLYHGYNGFPTEEEAGAGARHDWATTPRLRIKTMLDECGLKTLDVLHCDIQGAENSICRELEEDRILTKIHYFFISTHRSNMGINTHPYCLDFLSNRLNCKYHFNNQNCGGWGDGLMIVENLDWKYEPYI